MFDASLTSLFSQAEFHGMECYENRLYLIFALL